MGQKELKMFILYLILCLVLIAILIRATNKNYKDIQRTKEYLESCEKMSIKIEKLEKRNIRAIHGLWVMNQKINWLNGDVANKH